MIKHRPKKEQHKQPLKMPFNENEFKSRGVDTVMKNHIESCIEPTNRVQL